MCTNMNGSFACSCPPILILDDDQRNCVGKCLSSLSEGPPHGLRVLCVCVGNTTEEVSNGSGGGVNGGAIAGGLIAALLAVGVIVAIVILVLFFVRKRRAEGVHKTTKYSRPRDDLESTSSRQNLFSTTPSSQNLGSVQFRGQGNRAYTSYQPPAPVYSGGTPQSPDDQPRRPPPRPPTAATPAPVSLSQSPGRRVAPPPPQPYYPAPSAPEKPPAPSRPKPPSAPMKPLLPTKPAVYHPPPQMRPPNSYVPPQTFRPPPPANKPALQPRPPPPTSQKSTPGETLATL